MLDKNKKNTVVCVLSMHRSGSSMIIRILNICGVYIGGEDELVGAGDGNQKGHWEHKEILEINEAILKIFNGSVVDIPNFPENWQKDERLSGLYTKGKLFVEKMNKRSDLWGFKEPRTCITLPFWQEIIPNMVYIIPVRGVSNVANSLKKRNNTSLEYGMFLWIDYWRKILENTYGKKRFFTFQENYFISWRKELEKIANFLNNKHFNFRDNEVAIDNFISPDLLHKKIKKRRSVGECVDRSDFYLKEIIDLFLSDLKSLYEESEKNNKYKVGIIENELNRKNQKISRLEKEVELMQSSKFWKARNFYIYLKNGIKFALLSPKKFLKKYFKNKKLIMTLLVRDEVDIIEKNIEFHLNQGVDFIIATDNGSIDGTREILQKYEKKGKLHLIDEPSQDYSQAIWVNRMGRIAHENYRADYIFHCDADEFWYPKSSNLKNEISKNNTNLLKVELTNILLEDNTGLEKFPKENKWAVINPLETKNLEKDSKKENLYLFRYPQKVFYKITNKYLEVVQGNHDILNKENLKEKKSDDIIIYHFPIRRKRHFFKKIENGGSAYENNKTLKKKMGWHWRRWYDAYKNGKLEEEYKKLIITREKAEELKEKGIIEDFNFEEFLKK
jgi:hypothetical protein